MTIKKNSLLIVATMLAAGLFVGLVLNFQPVLAGSTQPEFNSMDEAGLQSFAVPQAELDPACPLNTTDAISYWDLNESSGPSYTDSIGGHNGSCTGGNCPSSISGTSADGQFFVSTDPDAITVGTHEDFDFLTTENFSAGIWVKTTQNCTGNKVFMGRYGSAYSEGRWWLGCVPGGSPTEGVARFHMRDSDYVNARSPVGSTPINDGKWHYITGVWDGTDSKLYVDGGLEATISSPTFTGDFTSTEPLTIGAYDEPLEYVNGALDEAAVFGTALSGTFISTYIGKCSFDIKVGDVTFDTSKNVSIPVTTNGLLANSQAGLTLNVVDTNSVKGGNITGTAPNFSYNPPTDYVGTDYFTFEVTDGGTTARGTAIITQEKPLVTDPGPQTDYEGEAVSLQIVATDAYGDELTYEISGVPGLPLGLSIDVNTGLISGNVAAGALSNDHVKVRVRDFKGYSTQIEFAWTILPNDIPEITPIPNQSNAEGETITPLQVVASDGDVADTLTYGATNLPPGLTINTTSGLISGTVSAGAAATSPYSVIVTVSDGIADLVQVMFNWTIESPINYIHLPLISGNP